MNSTMHTIDSEPWRPGAVIVQEEYWRHQLVTVRPVTVVEDSETLLALYSHAGAPLLTGAMRNRQKISLEQRVRVYLSDEQPLLSDGAGRANVLTLTPPRANHSVWLFWDRDWNLIAWYVNLQPPFRRTPHGVVTGDYLLDLMVTPDLRWSWKDEDEFEAVCTAGVFTDDERRGIREEGLRMVERIESRQWPFDSEWPQWRPDPSWPVPALPDDWQRHGPPNVR
jgi:predicted RNA-binding protein associated with RNAse of E/G family